MPISKEEVQAKAKELGVDLSDEQVNAYVLINTLPTKEAEKPDPDNDDDGDDKDLTAEMKKRLAKEKEKREKLAQEKAELEKKVKEAEAAKADKDRKDAEAKGEYEKLLKENQERAEKMEQEKKALRDSIKASAIKSEVKTALLAAGCSKENLPKALRLFDLSKVEFSWVDEEKLEHEVEPVDSIVEAFKKDNAFFFATEDGSQSYTPNLSNNHRRKAGDGEQERKRLESSFPALRGLSKQ